MTALDHEFNVVLDRFEYKFDSGKFHLSRVKVAKTFTACGMRFPDEQSCTDHIESVLKNRKRYAQIKQTLSETELVAIFGNLYWLKQSPKNIKTIVTDDEYKYQLRECDNRWEEDSVKEFDTIDGVKRYLIDNLLDQHYLQYDLNLVDIQDNQVD